MKKLPDWHRPDASVTREHTVDGSTRPMELHLVHRNAQGGLAVIGVFLEEGSENAAAGVMANADDLFPEAQT